MAEIDKKAQAEYGIPGATLMENAGCAVVDVIKGKISSLKDEKIAILCGKGNNGGDGYVIARHLAPLVGKLTVFAADPEEIKPGDAKGNYLAAKQKQIEILPLEDLLAEDNPLAGYTIIVDALFGTGFKGEMRDPYGRVGDAVNSSGLMCFAVDVPSGLDSTTGCAAKSAIKAQATVTFGLPKTGFYLEDGPRVSGEIIVKNIGLPQELLI